MTILRSETDFCQDARRGVASVKNEVLFLHSYAVDMYRGPEGITHAALETRIYSN
jgi:hypothetical protein